MDLACMADSAWRSLNQVMVFGAAVFVLLMFVVSTLGTPLVMWLYRRRVVALMSARDDAERDDADAEALPGHHRATPAPLAAGQLAAEAASRQKRLRNVLIAACAVYSVVAGLMMTFSPDVVLDAKAAALPERTPLQWGLTVLFDALLVGALCMPIVLIGTAHPRFSRLYWRRFVPLFLAAAAVRWSVHTDDSDGATLGMAFLALSLGGCFVALVWLAVARRHARQVAPLLNVLMGTMYAGMALVLWVLLVVGR